MLINPNATQPVTAPVALGAEAGGSGRSLRVESAGSPAAAVVVTGPLPADTSSARSARVRDASPSEVQADKPDAKELDQAVMRAKEYIQSVRRDLNLNYDEETGLLVIKVIDKETEEVVRQIPAEEILAFIQNMLKLTGEREGVLLKEKA